MSVCETSLQALESFIKSGISNSLKEIFNDYLSLLRTLKRLIDQPDDDISTSLSALTTLKKQLHDLIGIYVKSNIPKDAKHVKSFFRRLSEIIPDPPKDITNVMKTVGAIVIKWINASKEIADISTADDPAFEKPLITITVAWLKDYSNTFFMPLSNLYDIWVSKQSNINDVDNIEVFFQHKFFVKLIQFVQDPSITLIAKNGVKEFVMKTPFGNQFFAGNMCLDSDDIDVLKTIVNGHVNNKIDIHNLSLQEKSLHECCDCVLCGRGDIHRFRSMPTSIQSRLLYYHHVDAVTLDTLISPDAKSVAAGGSAPAAGGAGDGSGPAAGGAGDGSGPAVDGAAGDGSVPTTGGAAGGSAPAAGGAGDGSGPAVDGAAGDGSVPTTGGAAGGSAPAAGGAGDGSGPAVDGTAASKIRRLREELRTKQGDVEALTADKTRLTSEIKQLKTASEKHQGALDALTAEKDKLKEELQTKQGDVEALTADNTRLTSEIKQLKTASEKHQGRLDALTAEKDKLKEELQTKQGDVEALTADNKRLTSEITELKTASEKHRKDFDALTAEKDKLALQVTEFEKAPKEQQGDIDAKDVVDSADEDATASNKEVIAQLLAKIETMNENKKNLEEQVEILKMRNDITKQQLVKVLAKIEKLEKRK
jgi:predicted nuclease with TOPRIM domain